MSSDLVVVLVPPAGALQAVVGHLADWCAAGVLGEFVVTSSAPGTGLAGTLGASWVIGPQGRTPVRLSSHLADRDPGRVRVVLLSSPLGGVPSVTAASALTLVSLLREASSARIVQMNLILVRGLANSAPLVLEGWHNVLVSPEHGRTPEAAREDLPDYSTPDDLARYATPTVAALAGLVLDIPSSPLDDLVAPPGNQVRTARSYLTTLDAGEVEELLRDGTVNLGGVFPAPYVGTAGSTHVESTSLATSDMAEKLWSRWGPKLLRPRSRPQEEPLREVKVLEALRMLFSFLAAALRGAPGAWWRRTVAVGKARVASRVSDLVFGNASAYRAIMPGQAYIRRAPADWQTQLHELGQLGSVLTSQTTGHDVHIDLSSLWKDLAEGCFTLCDGLERDSLMPPLVIGEQIAVLTRASDCMGSGIEGFELPAGGVSVRLGEIALAPSDYLGAIGLHEQLGYLDHDEDLGPEVGSVARSLQAWMKARNQTFGFQVARRIGHDYGRCVEEIQEYLGILRDVGTHEDEAPASQRSLAARLLVVLGITVASVVTVGVLVGMAIIGWLLATALAVVLVGGWLMASLIVFMSSQRELFQLLHRRRAAASRAELAQANLLDAVTDARNLGDCYRMYLTWARILGAFLADPLASGAHIRTARKAVADPLPLSVRFAHAVPDGLRVAKVGHVLKQGAFEAGWLTSAWESCLKQEVDDLGARGVSLGGDPQRLFHARVPDDSLVRAVADALDADGVATSGSSVLWASILGRVTRDDRLLADLVGEVKVSGRRIPLSTYRVAQEPSDAQYLSGTPFSPTGRNKGLHKVAQSWERVTPRGLGWVQLMVQFSVGGSGDDLATMGPVSVPPEPTPPAQPPPESVPQRHPGVSHVTGEYLPTPDPSQVW
ncbi:hypothetical protein V3N99_21315 [Dermatophilaceae bacterium Soc4.6]